MRLLKYQKDALLDKLFNYASISLSKYISNCSIIEQTILKGSLIYLEEGKNLKNKTALCCFTKNTNKCIIKCNLHTLINIQNEYRYDVISHEVAHAIEFLMFGESNHSNRWSQIHKSIGGSGLGQIKIS